MTFCDRLMSRKKGEKIITAWRLMDKNAQTFRYEITVSVDGIAQEAIKTARTTWRRKFDDVYKAI